MRTVLIIHGIGGHAGIHWQQWLHDELLKQEYEVLMPSLPDSDHPDRQMWLSEIKKILKGVELGDLTIVGHSLGVTTALDFIEQASGQVDGLVSAAGFAEDYGADMNGYFLREKAIDFAKVKQHLRWSAVVYGGNDPHVTQVALKQVADALAVPATIIPNGGHLNTEAGFTQFPQLMEVLR